MSVHWVKSRHCGSERRDLILTRSAYQAQGAVKSLGAFPCGPVGLVHTQKFGIKYKEPPRLMLIRNSAKLGRLCAIRSTPVFGGNADIPAAAPVGPYPRKCNS